MDPFDVYAVLDAYRRKHPEQRTGQAFFNAASERWPDLADEARGDHDLDPFYDNRKVGAFCTFLMERLYG
jgi:hypothetical protein